MNYIQFSALNSDSPFHLFYAYTVALECAIIFIMYLYFQPDTYWANNLCSEHMDTESDIPTDLVVFLLTPFIT